jgi:hypothetical protein
VLNYVHKLNEFEFIIIASPPTKKVPFYGHGSANDTRHRAALCSAGERTRKPNLMTIIFAYARLTVTGGTFLSFLGTFNKDHTNTVKASSTLIALPCAHIIHASYQVDDVMSNGNG